MTEQKINVALAFASGKEEAFKLSLSFLII